MDNWIDCAAGDSNDELPLPDFVPSEVEFWPAVLALGVPHSLPALTDDDVDDSFAVCLGFLLFFCFLFSPQSFGAAA